MKAVVKINGKEINANVTNNYQFSISEEELKKLIDNPPSMNTAYDRVPVGKSYYYITASNKAYERIESRDSWDYACYDVANYYSDKKVAEDNARADKLMQQLRRFIAKYRKTTFMDWEDEDQSKYFIYYNYKSKSLEIDLHYSIKDLGQLYFDSKEVAKLAIDTFKSELIWYFTIYNNDSL